MFVPLAAPIIFLHRLHRFSSLADPSASQLRARHSQCTSAVVHIGIFFVFLSLYCSFLPSVSAAGEPVTSPVASPLPSFSPLASPLPSSSPSSVRPSASEVSSLLSLKASWFDPFNSLESWHFSSNIWVCQWRGVLCSNDNSTVVSLTLTSLSLSGPLPPSIAHLTSLRTLNLAFNQLIGNIPAELGSLTSLKVLQLRHNLFNGSIPQSIYAITSLQFLMVENNRFTGNISSSISNLRNLAYFSFAYNGLSGTFPPSFTNLTKLIALYGANNRLLGGFPARIGDLRSLVYLDLQGNSLTGDIPSSIGSLTMLKLLELSDNELSGLLPAELGMLRRVTYLDLSYNNFNGTIPEELANMSSLEALHLHRNNFSGSISPSLGGLTRLKSLNFSYNNLSGEVPTNGVLANFSAASFEGNTFLCGGPLINCVSPPPPTLVPLPSPPLTPLPSSTDVLQQTQDSDDKWKVVTGVVIGAFALSSIFVCGAWFVWRSKKKEIAQIQNRLSPDITGSVSNSKLEMYSRGFTLSYEEVVACAGYYDTAHVVGKGRFATVYRSDLPVGSCIAVKVFKNPIPQLAFEKEVEGLESACHFDTLLPIRGYFSSPGEKAILYDYMPNGNLYDLLHNNPDAHTQLDWSRRLTIAMGIAQALAHLHKGSNIRVLHKDVKSTNVLLDQNMYPFVTDYGLIGLVSKTVVETPGYTPPELKTTKKYTEKSDVYSFGVVLLELLTGKKPVSYIGDRQLNLVTWALRLQRDGRGREVFSANLVESCPYPEYPDRALNLAVLCLTEVPAQRPTMSETASILEGLGGLNSPSRSPGAQQDKPLLY
ncbi:hypothetical protein L7F22_060171 [Adiantum nelumboides]|nr:hypothetical protein [Adiantum nelumboides]